MRIGIDLGGTKIEGIALDSSGQELARRRIPSRRDYEGTLSAVAEMVAWLEKRTGRHGSVGIGIPGALSPATGRVKNANSTWLIGRPLDRDLAERLGRPVRLRNDADCFALSEASDGAGSGAAVVFGVILGTGVGGGIVVDGRCLEGPNRIAGEWGHCPLPWPGPEEIPGPSCYCGKHGCVETFLSGPGLAKDHARVAGEHLDVPELARRAARGDPAARATLDRHHDRLARALAVVLNVLDPDVVVLGGGLSNLPGLAGAAAAGLPRWVFGSEVRTRIVRNRHGDSSGVRGAAWLWGAGHDAAEGVGQPPGESA